MISGHKSYLKFANETSKSAQRYVFLINNISTTVPTVNTEYCIRLRKEGSEGCEEGVERARVVYLAPPPDPMNPVVQVRFHLQIVNSSHMTKRITELLSVHNYDFILVIIS